MSISYDPGKGKMGSHREISRPDHNLCRREDQGINGDKSVSATFVVGGGGKIHGFTEMLADKLGLPHERGTSRRRSITGSTF